jgi:hypothetical protein
VIVAAPALARTADRLDRIEEIALTLPSDTGGSQAPEELALRVEHAAGEVHRIQVGATAVKYDADTGTFHVRLATSDERIVAAMKVVPKGSYLARTREGVQFKIRRQEVTLHELDVIEGRELMRDVELQAPRSLASELRHGLVAVCEFRTVRGADGLPLRDSVETYQPSFTEPLEGRVTTRVIRVVLESVTLQSATSGRVYRRIEGHSLVTRSE